MGRKSHVCDTLRNMKINLRLGTEMLQKIFIQTFFALFLAFSLQVHAEYCAQGNGVDSCSNCPYGPPSCSLCFVTTGQQYTTTYCSDCGVCVAGMSDCVAGLLGCNQCNIATGYDDGYICNNVPVDGGRSYICGSDYNDPCQ